jgi:hypothetical protein
MNSKARTISSRQFQHEFARISKKLKPGESVKVTNRGETVGTFTREPRIPRLMPDFYANIQKLGVSREVGQRMIDAIVNGLP